MHPLDYIVLAGYFTVMIVIGVVVSRHIKKQEDYFMGGRSFGKLLQTFAAFGAGTGSSDPVNTANTTFTNGMSGMWSVMYWLFVTPFYWITGVWYRRMRHMTLGDWFVERYESKALGVGYTIFGLLFFIFYGSMFFSAIGKVAAPVIGVDEAFGLPLEYVLVPVIGAVVLGYGILGGLEAAYFTDLIQGICIILLSVILIPFGLLALVKEFGDPATMGMMDGFRILHEQVSPEKFSVIGSGASSEFPLHRIIAVVIINLVGIVVQPHFIATGGGSAKTELNARVGLVTGNFLKRFCTVGWVLTALVAAALYADHPTLQQDPQQTWGYASKMLLGPGLTGLMLACLLAALMSSVDCYMVVGAGLVVRNVYATYINQDATEAHLVFLGRVTGGLIVAGAVTVSLTMFDVFEQLKLTWVFGVLFAAPFWVGMYWRRATKAAAWCSVAFCALTFFILPMVLPQVFPALRSQPQFLIANDMFRVTTTRTAAPSDVRAADQAIELWAQALEKAQTEGDAERIERLQSSEPERLAVGDAMKISNIQGGSPIYWPDGLVLADEQNQPLVDADGKPLKPTPVPVGEPEIADGATRQRLQIPNDARVVGSGSFRLDFLLYQAVGLKLTAMTDATLETLTLPVKIVSPFLVMILVSLITPRNSQEALDRYYAKMKTPVVPDHEEDQRRLQAVLADRDALEAKKLFPGSSFEFQRPSVADVTGFIVCVGICFAIIYLAVLLAGIGA